MTDLQQSLNNVNLKKCEEIINDLSCRNFGGEINANIKKMKDAYDMFDYQTVKDVVVTVINSIKGEK